MTSGPMRAGALPPDRRPHSRACGFRRHDHGPDCHSNCPSCHGGPSAAPAARKPLTVADIPAGQGAASLYLAPDDNTRELVVWEKADDGTERVVYRRSTWGGAVWEHLAATLPTIDTTEEP